MAALANDIYVVRYGTDGDAHQLLNFPLGPSTTVYRGSFASLNGTGANQGYLKNAATPASTDIIAGLIDTGGPGYNNTSPGVINGSTVAGAVTADILTGSFYLQTDGSLSQSTIGQTVYAVNETTVSTSSSGGTLPKAGVHLFWDPAPPPTAMSAAVVKLNILGSP